MITHRFWPVLSVLLAIGVKTRHAGAYCAYGSEYNWRNALDQNGNHYTRIPVVIHPTMHNRIRKPNGTLWTQDELKKEVEWVSANFNTFSGANMPPLFVEGLSTVCEDCQQPFKIHVTTTPTCGPLGLAFGKPGSDGVKVQLKRSDICTTRWVHWENPFPDPATDYTFAGTLTHELGHALGLGHPEDCGSMPGCLDENGNPGVACQVMGTSASTTHEATTLYMDDIAGLRFKYGAYPTANNRVHEESSTGGNPWDGLATPPAQMLPHSSLSSSTLPRMLHVYGSSLFMLPCAHEFDWWSWGWTTWGCASEATNGPVGSAIDGTYRWMYYLREEIANMANKSIGIRRLTAPNTGTTYTNVSERTRRHGISATTDPQSGNRIIAYRNHNGEIRIRINSGTGGTLDPSMAIYDSSSLPVVAYASPSVACGDASIWRNCILVWADPASATGQYHTMRWMHFRLSSWWGWYVDPGPIMGNGYIMFSAPQVAYKGPAGDSNAFVVSWMNPGCSWYTLGKTSAENSVFAGETGHSTSCKGITQPAIGSAAGWAELMNTFWP